MKRSKAYKAAVEKLPGVITVVKSGGQFQVVIGNDVPHLYEEMAKITKVGDAAVALLEFFERFDEEKYGTDGGPLHDPCVIAYLLKPELFKGRTDILPRSPDALRKSFAAAFFLNRPRWTGSFDPPRESGIPGQQQ